MSMKSFSPAVIALLAGAAVGYCLKPSEKAAPAEAPAAPEAKAVTKIAEVDDASVKALRARVKDLERQLAEKSETKVEEGAEERRERGGWPNGEDMRANFDKFRQEHPEEYAKMEEGRKAFMKRRQERAQSQLDFLSSVDTSKMSAESKASHEKLLALIAKRQSFESKITPEAVLNATDEERRQGFEEMMSTEREIRELKEKERGILLQQTAEELGFGGEDAKAIVDTIGEIYEVTGNGGGFGGMFGGFGGGRGGRGGRGEGRGRGPGGQGGGNR